MAGVHLDVFHDAKSEVKGFEKAQNNFRELIFGAPTN